MMIKHHLKSVLAGAMFSLFGAIPSQAMEVTYPKIVLELFTSQGCSSCPPADKILGQIVENKDVLALSLPVNYWDRLGWKDTLGSQAYTDRQFAYANFRGDKRVYTPQIVLDGGEHVVGSRFGPIEWAIQKARMGGSRISRLKVKVVEVDNKVTLTLDPEMSNSNPSYKVIAMPYIEEVKVSIGRGENAGRTIEYHNVVRDIKNIGGWTGMPIKFEISAMDMKEYSGVALIVQEFNQDGKPGPVKMASNVIF